MRGILSAVLVTVVLVTGCDRSESEWKAAQQANTADAYSGFLAKHPQGARADEAKRAIDDLAWSVAKAKNTADAYDTYMTQYALGRHLAEAKAAIEDVAWLQAKMQNTVEAYKAYLDRYPQGRYPADAAAAIEGLLVQTFALPQSDGNAEEFISSLRAAGEEYSAYEPARSTSKVEMRQVTVVVVNNIADLWDRFAENGRVGARKRGLTDQERQQITQAIGTSTTDYLRKRCRVSDTAPYKLVLVISSENSVYMDSESYPCAIAPVKILLLDAKARQLLWYTGNAKGVGRGPAGVATAASKSIIAQMNRLFGEKEPGK